jgi:hypothetical protein
MQRTSIRWGKAAKLAAAAAVVFAMREQGRGDRTHYVAVSTSSPLFFNFDRIGLPGQVLCRLAPRLDALWLWPAASYLGTSAFIFLGPHPLPAPSGIAFSPYSRRWLTREPHRVSHQLNPLSSLILNVNHELLQLTHFSSFTSASALRTYCRTKADSAPSTPSPQLNPPPHKSMPASSCTRLAPQLSRLHITYLSS